MDDGWGRIRSLLIRIHPFDPSPVQQAQTEPEDMPKLTIYQKPTCSTCRDVMARLSQAGVDYDAINYILEPPSRAKLAELVRKMDLSPRDVMRTKEEKYRELGLGDPSIGDEKLLDAM